jgi:hypothetical protein
MSITVVEREPTLSEALWQTRLGELVKSGLKRTLKFYGFLVLAAVLGSVGDGLARALVANTKEVGNIGSWVVGLPVLIYAVRRPIRWIWRLLLRRPVAKPESAEPAEPVPNNEPRESEPDPESLYVGERLDTASPASLDAELRHRHLYVIGKSGSGTTTL